MRSLHRSVFLLFLTGCGLDVDEELGVETTALGVPDVTASLEYVGNPARTRWPDGDGIYARNPWDLAVWKGRLYLGQGNSSNAGPAPNAGPADIISYDPASGAFATELRTSEEQVERFVPLDGQLFVPGHDPVGVTASGNNYSLGDAGWVVRRVHPGAIHVYDLHRYNDTWYAAIGADDLATVQKANRPGGPWRDVVAPPLAERGYNLFTLRANLYLSSKRGIYRRADLLLGETFVAASTRLLLGAGSASPAIIVRERNVGTSLVYIVARNVNDHQWEPIQLNVADSEDTVRRAALPVGELPWDIIERPNATYVLTSRAVGTQHQNTVWRSTDLKVWTPLLTFQAATFARSFELLNNDFYFGLGCNTAPRPQATGDILRIDASTVLP